MMYSRLARLPAMSARSCSLVKSLSSAATCRRWACPTVAGATVAAEVLDHKRGPKVIAFKRRRRKNSRRKRGDRDEITCFGSPRSDDNAKPTIGLPPKREKVAPAPAADGDDEAPKAARKKAPAKKAVGGGEKAPAKKAAVEGQERQEVTRSNRKLKRDKK